MENNGLLDQLDHQRWLMNNGMFTESAKNNLYMYGSLVHTEVQAVALAIDPIKRELNYVIYFTSSTLSIKNKLDKLRFESSLIARWRFRNLLKKHGSMDFRSILQNFVNDYCGPNWKVNLKLDNINNYKEESELDISSESGGITSNAGLN